MSYESLSHTKWNCNVIVMAVLGISLFVVITALREEGVFPFRCRDRSVDKILTDQDQTSNPRH
ncbi:MAG TPA: hypothetical protein PKV48_06630 [Thermodesulfobacteriota bacterium]|nr:hypothetical protein [Thermodesulfobacteriota bacterium]